MAKESKTPPEWTTKDKATNAVGTVVGLVSDVCTFGPKVAVQSRRQGE